MTRNTRIGQFEDSMTAACLWLTRPSLPIRDLPRRSGNTDPDGQQLRISAVAEHRHKRETDARRKPRAAIVAAPLALLATASAVTIGVLAGSPVTADDVLAQDASDISRVTTSRDTVSRADSRLERAQLQKAYDRNHQRVATTNRDRERRHPPVGHLGPQPVDRLRQGRQAGRRGQGRQAVARHRPQGRRPCRGRHRRVAPVGHRGLPQRREAGRRAGRSVDGTLPRRGRRERPDQERGLRLPLRVPRLPADHVVRRLGRPRRALLGQGAGHHDQRRRARHRDRGLPAGSTPRSSSSTTSSGASGSSPSSVEARAGEACRRAGRPPPTTSTTCTCRPTDRTRPAAQPLSAPAAVRRSRAPGRRSRARAGRARA